MTLCARNGYLVDTSHALPTDPTDLDVEGLPVVGCTRLRCQRCGAVVRNAPGLAFATRAEVSAAELSALYDLADLESSPLIHRTEPKFRLYLCRCSRWLETSEHAVGEPDPDPDTDPQVPWRCDGHSQLTLPHDIDGERVASARELREVAIRALRGNLPPRARPADQTRSAWLVRLRARVGAAEAAVLDAAATGGLEDADPRVRSRALHYLDYTGNEAARERLLELLQSRRVLFAGIADETPLFKSDSTLDDTAWRVIAPLAASAGLAREVARAEALAGRGSRAIFDTLARYDGTWLVEHIDDLARIAPRRAGDLVDSFSRLPKDRQSPQHAARVRQALVGNSEPLDAIRAASRELAKRIRREVPVEGTFAPIQHALPALHTGTQLEIEVGPADAGRLRVLQLRIEPTACPPSAHQVKRGSNIELIIFLESAQVAERIVYQARDAEERR